jgi:polyisoprenoid-binding protein YceI
MRTPMTALALAAAFGANAATAGTVYSIDPVHSNVTFKVRHLIAKTGGEFNRFAGTVTVDFSNLDNSAVELVIDAASIDTNNEERDAHLRSPDFFDVETYPEIRFVSTKITKVQGTTYAVAGTLTMHGVSKDITLTVSYLGTMEAMGGTRAGFELSTELNRKDFDIVWNRTLDNGGLVLGDAVEIEIDLEVVAEQTEAIED